MRHHPTWVASLFLGLLLACQTETGAGASAQDVDGTNGPGGDDGNARRERPAFEAELPPDGQPGGDGGTPSTPGTCNDPNDPGSSEPVAKALADTTDADNTIKTVNGVANGPIDIDFYKLTGRDETFHFLDTTFSTPTANIEICVYARCLNSTVDAVTGCKAGAETTSAAGMKGCCAVAGEATPVWDCSGITDNDSADFSISLRQKPGSTGNACVPYELKYRY